MRTLIAALTALMLFATPVAAASDPPVQSAEVVFWQSISSSTDADDFIAYLKRYPHGVFAPLARNKLKRMGVVVIAPEAPPKPQPAVVPSKPVNDDTSYEGRYRATLPCGATIQLQVSPYKIEGWIDAGSYTYFVSGDHLSVGHFDLLVPDEGGGGSGTLSGSLSLAVFEGGGEMIRCPTPFAFTKVE